MKLAFALLNPRTLRDAAEIEERCEAIRAHFGDGAQALIAKAQKRAAEHPTLGFKEALEQVNSEAIRAALSAQR
jgi:hypothetical protein